MIPVVDGWGTRSGLDGPDHGDWPPGWTGRKADLDVLCSAPLLDGLDPQDVAALLPAFRFATVHVDQELIIQGESGAAQVAVGHAGPFAGSPPSTPLPSPSKAASSHPQLTNQDQLHRRSDTPAAAAGRVNARL